MSKRFFISLLFVMVASAAIEKVAAQAITIGGELRTRTEVRSGAVAPLYDSLGTALVTVMRSRLNMAYTSNVMKAKLVLQDTHVFGQTSPTALSTGTFGIYEAWGEYLLAPGISVAMGRQAIEYDDKRLFSASNWSNTGNAHDLLLMKYTSTDFILHLGAAWNNASDVYQETAYTTTYKSMTYLWASKPLGKFNLTALWVNEGYQRTNNQANVNDNKRWYRNTIGGNLSYSAENFPVTFYGTGYYQFGHGTTGKQLDAYLLASKIQAKASKTVAFNLGADCFSGSKYDSATTEDHTFNKLFGANHSFNGSMEYWKSMPTGGLIDLYFGPEVAIGPKLKAEASYHAFSLAQQQVKTFDHKGLGSELDLTFTYPVSSVMNLQGGWSGYFANALVTSVKKLKAKVDQKFPQWAFIMITIKPTFLSVK
jgi:hypothetical protein